MPFIYDIDYRCRRLCESSLGDMESILTVTSPHSTDITPYTQCAFSLVGLYGIEFAYLTTKFLATTSFFGKVFFYS